MCYQCVCRLPVRLARQRSGFSTTGSLVHTGTVTDALATPVITLGSREIPAAGAYLVPVATATGMQHFKVTKL